MLTRTIGIRIATELKQVKRSRNGSRGLGRCKHRARSTTHSAWCPGSTFIARFPRCSSRSNMRDEEEHQSKHKNDNADNVPEIARNTRHYQLLLAKKQLFRYLTSRSLHRLASSLSCFPTGTWKSITYLYAHPSILTFRHGSNALDSVPTRQPKSALAAD